ncbi:MAG: hypothetical protein EOO59_11125 [Hymenobacter sp.]|nr:MAG: hypothetical protein EOO59_11125 [Hymenobacter sp.]
MERTIRRLLLGWLGLLAGVVLAYHYGYAKPAYWLLWPVALGSPLVVGTLGWLLVLRLREVWHRVRVLRRARHWRRQQAPDDRWLDTPWEEV